MNILYECDRKGHCEHECFKWCNHTSHEEFARNKPNSRRYVKSLSGDFWEVDRTMTLDSMRDFDWSRVYTDEEVKEICGR